VLLQAFSQMTPIVARDDILIPPIRLIDIASRSAHIASITPHPDNSWITQIARKITDVNDRFLRSNSSSFTTSPNGLGSVFRQSARSINVRTPSGLYWADGLWARGGSANRSRSP
jgi:hypothetical protein